MNRIDTEIKDLDTKIENLISARIGTNVEDWLQYYKTCKTEEEWSLGYGNFKRLLPAFDANSCGSTT
jgi:hypothetical protein